MAYETLPYLSTDSNIGICILSSLFWLAYLRCYFGNCGL